MPVLPTNNIANGARTSGVVTYTIMVDGREVPATVQVYSLDVWTELNKIPRAKVVVIDGNPAAETFSVSEGDWFVPGKNIELKIGYRSDESTIFKGMITGQSIKARANGNSILSVECADPAVMLTRTTKSRYFYDVSESDVFEQIISEYSRLGAEIESTQYTHKELLQFQSIDWDFILSRADINGLLCLVDAGTISIKKPDFSQEPVETVSYGNNLFELDAEIDATTQLGSVKGQTWDYSKTESSEVEAVSASPVTPSNLSSNDLSSSFGDSDNLLRAGAKIPNEILQSWANTKLMKHELAKVRGRAQMRGLPTVKPGAVIELAGVGDRFNGKAFVSGVKHGFYKGEWLMDVQFGITPEWFSQQYKISEDPAAGMLPSVSGLQIGLITQIESDPEGDDRILVRLPMIDTEEQGVWARLATPGAGDNRGVIIRPEIEDEVVVGFIHGDPNHPIILGALNSGNRPAPVSPSDDNHEKGWVTRGEIKMLINDDKPSITIEMPSGKKIAVDDDAGEITLDDEHGNKFHMNSDGLTLESPADITIKATGDLTMEGTNINAKANAGFKAEGSASAEISSSGSTAVKGSVVQIN